MGWQSCVALFGKVKLLGKGKTSICRMSGSFSFQDQDQCVCVRVCVCVFAKCVYVVVRKEETMAQAQTRSNHSGVPQQPMTLT